MLLREDAQFGAVPMLSRPASVTPVMIDIRPSRTTGYHQEILPTAPAASE